MTAAAVSNRAYIILVWERSNVQTKDENKAAAKGVFKTSFVIPPETSYSRLLPPPSSLFSVFCVQCHMYYHGAWSEPQAPPPPPPPPTPTAGDGVRLSHPIPSQIQHYPVPLHHNQQPLPHSPYPPNPSLSHPHCNPIPIQLNPSGNDPYAPHVGYASAGYPCAGEGTSAVAVAVQGVVRYGGEESMKISATEAIPQDGAHTVGYFAVKIVVVVSNGISWRRRQRRRR
ncbi:hypothetical protein KSP40_PGU007081 [Platanthera guangdongensis]|uniref:Uncharacterized protein n=1 Tax=Platanthera guangdongensis TaxID=2320717 RepID=A0ABR2MG27_9ASPA